jgi:hypothetical protein
MEAAYHLIGCLKYNRTLRRLNMPRQGSDSASFKKFLAQVTSPAQ